VRNSAKFVVLYFFWRKYVSDFLLLWKWGSQESCVSAFWFYLNFSRAWKLTRVRKLNANILYIKVTSYNHQDLENGEKISCDNEQFSCKNGGHCEPLSRKCKCNQGYFGHFCQLSNKLVRVFFDWLLINQHVKDLLVTFKILSIIVCTFSPHEQNYQWYHFLIWVLNFLFM